MLHFLDWIKKKTNLPFFSPFSWKSLIADASDNFEKFANCSEIFQNLNINTYKKIKSFKILILKFLFCGHVQQGVMG